MASSASVTPNTGTYTRNGDPMTADEFNDPKTRIKIQWMFWNSRDKLNKSYQIKMFKRILAFIHKVETACKIPYSTMTMEKEGYGYELEFSVLWCRMPHMFSMLTLICRNMHLWRNSYSTLTTYIPKLSVYEGTSRVPQGDMEYLESAKTKLNLILKGKIHNFRWKDVTNTHNDGSTTARIEEWDIVNFSEIKWEKF